MALHEYGDEVPDSGVPELAMGVRDDVPDGLRGDVGEALFEAADEPFEGG